VHRDLSAHTEEGYAYRVDVRLRAHGGAGHLVQTASALVEYYRQSPLWEVQALLKMRPVAGNLELGRRFLGRVEPVLRRARPWEEIAQSIRSMRAKAIQQTAASGAGDRDVKSGLGGIRDLEFMVQGLQLMHAPQNPGLIEGNTLRALVRLTEAGVLEAGEAAQLRDDYVLLRRIEHTLQILEDQQIHAIPQEEAQLAALARRLLGPDGTSERLLHLLNQCQARVRRAYASRLLRKA
jgi:[glutamine synthetase] adenylyltransferase / [glutamine synthetase]-adenylyl-L-tyrosine phosphorylase